MATSETIPQRPLGLIVTMLESMGYQATHFHDDLIFIEHNAFLLQMGDAGEDLSVWFNVDCEVNKIDTIMGAFKDQEGAFEFDITKSGTYKLSANAEDETLQIEFISS